MCSSSRTRSNEVSLESFASASSRPVSKLLLGRWFSKSEATGWPIFRNPKIGFEVWAKKTLETYQEYEIDPVEILGTADPLAIGLKIKEWNYHYLTLGQVMVMVLQGIHAIDTVRKLIGHTLPYKAAPGTIRGDFSINAPDLANVVGSACKNLVHASGNQAEAEQEEITNWFEPTEILSWERIDEFLHFVQGEFTTTEKETTMNKYTALEQIFESLKKVDPRNAAEHAYLSPRSIAVTATTKRRFASDAKPSLSSTSVRWKRRRIVPRAMLSSRGSRCPVASSTRMSCGTA